MQPVVVDFSDDNDPLKAPLSKPPLAKPCLSQISVVVFPGFFDYGINLVLQSERAALREIPRQYKAYLHIASTGPVEEQGRLGIGCPNAMKVVRRLVDRRFHLPEEFSLAGQNVGGGLIVDILVSFPRSALPIKCGGMSDEKLPIRRRPRLFEIVFVGPTGRGEESEGREEEEIEIDHSNETPATREGLQESERRG